MRDEMTRGKFLAVTRARSRGFYYRLLQRRLVGE